MGFVGGVGRTNIDLIYSDMERLPALGEEVYAKGFGLYLGGGAPATLVNLSRLGAQVRLLTFLGSGLFGDFARGEYAAAGVEAVELYQGAGTPTVVTSAMACGGDRAFMSYAEPIEYTDALLEEIFARLRGADIALMSAECPVALYRALKAEGTRLIFDTGWEEDLSEEKYADYLALADFYLPNRAEAMKLTGAASPEAAAEALEKWLPCPVVKLDREGCLYRENGVSRRVPPVPEVRAVDATGAGDAFAAGFAYGLLRGESIETCAQYGNITGATCVQAPGCLTRYVDAEALERTRAEVYGRRGEGAFTYRASPCSPG